MSGRPWVFARGWLLGYDGRGRNLGEGAGLLEIAGAAWGVNASTVFVVDEPAPAVLPEGWRVTGGGRDGEPVWRLEHDGEPGAAPERDAAAGRPRLAVVYIAGDGAGAAGDWAGMAPREICATLGRLESLLGVPWSSSTGRTAQRLILSTHPRRRGGLRLDPDPQIPAELEGGAVETAWQSWRRPLLGDELDAPWVHVFDLSAAYLAAWSSVHVGLGGWSRSSVSGFDPEGAGRAAFWRFPAGLDGLANLRPELPPAWLPRREWYSTPTVLRMLEVADGLEVPLPCEVIRWQTATRYLRGAAEKIRDARAACRGELARVRQLVGEAEGRGGVDVDELMRRRVVADAAEAAVKSLYRVQTGRFAMRRENGGPWARPDWGHLIRATARANLHRRISALGRAPFAIATDALVFASHEPDPVRFAGRVGLPVGDGLGHFRHEFTVPAGPLWERAGEGVAGARLVLTAAELAGELEAGAAVSA